MKGSVPQPGRRVGVLGGLHHFCQVRRAADVCYAVGIRRRSTREPVLDVASSAEGVAKSSALSGICLAATGAGLVLYFKPTS